MHRVRQVRRNWLPSILLPIFVLTGLLFAAAATTPSTVDAQDDAGADLYASNCAGCHQANGEGVSGAFPPLAGNPAASDTEYVSTVIKEGLSGPIEVLGVTYDSAMPPISGLSDDEVALVTAHVVELSGGGDSTEPTEPTEPVEPTEPTAPAAPVDPPVNGDIDSGHDLFIGSDRLDAGGGACASCHVAGKVGNLGGSSLGPDLTDVYQNFGGEAGLTAWLQNPPSKTMAPIFSEDPMTEEEIADIVAFLADAPDQERPSYSVDWLLVAGLAGLVVLIGGMAIAWRGPRRTYAETLRSKK